VLTELIAQRNGYEDLYRDVLRNGVSEGSLSLPNVEIAGRMVMGALNGLVDWYRVSPDQTEADREDIALTLARTIVRGLVPYSCAIWPRKTFLMIFPLAFRGKGASHSVTKSGVL